MSDHHKGMIAMARAARKRKSSSVASIATRLATKQTREGGKLKSMLTDDFDDSYRPKIMPRNQKMVDDLKSKRGTNFDRAFLEHTVMHHEEGIKMIDKYLPKGKMAAIKQMARKMKADQSREIAEFRKRAATLTD